MVLRPLLRFTGQLLLAAFVSIHLGLCAWAAENAGHVPRFEPASCWLSVPSDTHARCGYLVVPENRRDPGGKRIRLAVAIIPAARTDAPNDPLLYLAGGPGGVPIFQTAQFVASGFNAERDLVIVNQRGTFLSQPALVCPGIDRFFRRLLEIRFDSSRARRGLVRAALACRDSLVRRDIDLAAFNTTENAADLADLREVLGYRKWNVYGVSYGTDLALALLRRDRQGIRSLVLDSTVPPNLVSFASFWPNAAEGFKALFDACECQRECRTRYPDLERRFTALVRKLERHPVATTIRDADDNPVEVVTDGGALANWLVSMSFATPLFNQVPSWIDEFERGRPQEGVALVVR